MLTKYFIQIGNFDSILSSFRVFYNYFSRDTAIENLEFLHVDQAVADAANFINGMNEKHNFSKSMKWVVIGGSYSGALAAWTRMKYPHLVHAAIASSAPLEAKLDSQTPSGRWRRDVVRLAVKIGMFPICIGIRMGRRFELSKG